MAERGAGDPALAPVRTKPAKPGVETHRPSAFWPVAGLVIPPILAVATIRVHDPEKLPTTGPFILAPNHLSNIDPVAVGIALWRLGRAPRFMAKSSLFRVPVLGPLMTAMGHVPVDRGGAGRGAIPLSSAKRLVSEGQGVIVYPEGSLTRDPDLWPMRGKTGAARLALQLGVPVIPVAHWGAQGLMPVNTTRFRLRPRPHIDVVFGDPVDLSDLGRVADRAALAEATDRIMAAITALLEQLRGETAPTERWDPAKHGQTETGTF
ncbi:lysophospholipid acyltransferase family protein [uncultured Amnibacterium sp.]|uniref:lysophospholipid acyltransferase family protein n=1 Tax=uncultured Amnibacterium sp. TaxID=1631851 RepID=UPI0035CBBD62